LLIYKTFKNSPQKYREIDFGLVRWGNFKEKEREKRCDTEGEKKGERKLQEVVESKRRDVYSFIERCVARKQVIIYIIKKYYNIEIV